jgi:DNA-binding response OmpR family regulator
VIVGSILLVETDPGTSDRWSRTLQAANHAVVIAPTEDAATALREGGIDVVVIDGHDQCLGVVELARAIELLPDAPPIVLVSSSTLAPKISAQIGAAAFLPKPCEPSELLAAVTRLLGTLRPVLSFEDEEPTGRQIA